MTKKNPLAASRERITAVRIAEAETLAERVRAGGPEAYRLARKTLKDGPIDQVRQLLQAAINDRPRTTPMKRVDPALAPAPPRSVRRRTPVPPHGQLIYLRKHTKLIGRLRRNGTGWVIEGKDGAFYAVSAVNEARPGPLVDRYFPWLIKGSKHKIVAMLQGDGDKRAEAREILGGAPGQGKSRKH